LKVNIIKRPNRAKESRFKPLVTVSNIQKKSFTNTPPVIDWLTLRISYIGEKLNLGEGYGFKVMEYQTRIFRRVIEITDIALGEVVATITDEPFSQAIRQDLILIKFHNKLLYNCDLKEYIINFCQVNNFKIEAVSRLDIAADFTQFANRLHPETFIKRFLKGAYVKKGQGKFKVAGKVDEVQPAAFDANGSYGSRIKHEYLRFGTINNGLKYYLYNKTKELDQVKEKPYIRERWKQYGHDGAADVWRLEFSLTSNDLRFIEHTDGDEKKPLSKGRHLIEQSREIDPETKKYLIQETLAIDQDTGEVKTVTEYNLKSIECLDQEILTKIWASLVNKYMVFYLRGRYRKDRNKKLILFKNLPDYVSYTCERSLTDSTNTDKNFVTNLRRTYEDTRTKDVVVSRELQKLLQYQVDRRGLHKWADKKDILNFEPGNPYEYKSDNKEIVQRHKADPAEKAKRFNKDD